MYRVLQASQGCREFYRVLTLVGFQQVVGVGGVLLVASQHIAVLTSVWGPICFLLRVLTGPQSTFLYHGDP